MELRNRKRLTPALTAWRATATAAATFTASIRWAAAVGGTIVIAAALTTASVSASQPAGRHASARSPTATDRTLGDWWVHGRRVIAVTDQAGSCSSAARRPLPTKPVAPVIATRIEFSPCSPEDRNLARAGKAAWQRPD